MNVVDSSGWLEYFVGGPNADFFAPAINGTNELVVPSVSLYEVFKKVLQERGEDPALQAVAVMAQGVVVGLDGALAISAARNAVEYRLPIADSLIWTTARAYDALLWTQDAHLQGLEGVRYTGHPAKR